MRGTTTLVIAAIVLLTPLILGACGGGPVSTPAATGTPKTVTDKVSKPGWEAEWEALLAAAKKEGTLTIYSTPSVDVMKEVAVPFKARFGIDVEYIVGRGEELARRMVAEQTRGIYNADVVISGGTTGLVTMKPQGLLGRLEPLLFLPEVRDSKVWRTGNLPFVDKEGYHLAMIDSIQRYMLRNTDLVKDNELKSYKDLLDPKWKSKMISNDPTIAGTGNAMYTFLAIDVWGMDQTLEYMRQMVKQEPPITRDTRQQVEWVSRGRYPIGIATLIEQTSEFIKLGAPIALVKAAEGAKSGAGAGGLQLPKQQAHPNAARVFVNWLLTKEGQIAFIRGFGHPSTRQDVPKTGIPAIFLPESDEKIFPDTEEGTMARGVMAQHAREIFAPLFK